MSAGIALFSKTGCCSTLKTVANSVVSRAPGVLCSTFERELTRKALLPLSIDIQEPAAGIGKKKTKENKCLKNVCLLFSAAFFLIFLSFLPPTGKEERENKRETSEGRAVCAAGLS